MGMFDSFYVPIICPYSGKEVAEAEFQTKDFECSLKEWRVGDIFEPESSSFKLTNGEITTYGSCKCEDCMIWEKYMNTHYNYNCHGHGRDIIGTIIIKNGKVEGTKDVFKSEDDKE